MSVTGSASLPTLLLVVVSALTVAGCGGVSISIGDDTTTRVETETIDVDGLAGISITTENGAVDVTGADVDAITIRAELTESDDDQASYSARHDGDDLQLEGSCDDRGWSNCAVAFEVIVPRTFDVEVVTDNGAVEVDGIDGVLVAHSDNGAIGGVSLASGTTDVSSDNGRIDLSFDEAPQRVDAHSDNGRIDVHVPVGPYAVDADSDNGSVDVDVATDPEADRSIRIRTDNGSIAVAPVES